MQKIWLITGCSSGFGYYLAKKLITLGETVVATARNVGSLDSLKTKDSNKNLFLSLDITDQEQINSVVKQVQDAYGRIDVLVNNAGYGLIGAAEECSLEAVRQQFETNFFGLVSLTKQVLPRMRKQKSGHILNLSSIAGLVATPGAGFYNASKFAVEGFSEALAAEVKHLGVKVTLIEPGPFRTDFAGRSIDHSTEIDDYKVSAGLMRKYIQETNGNQLGDPEKAIDAMIEVVKQEEAPLRLLLGSAAINRLDTKIESLKNSRDYSAPIAIACDYS